MSVSHLVPVLLVEKWLKKTKQKTAKMNLVPATESKAKKKFRLCSGYEKRGIPEHHADAKNKISFLQPKLYSIFYHLNKSNYITKITILTISTNRTGLVK